MLTFNFQDAGVQTNRQDSQQKPNEGFLQLQIQSDAGRTMAGVHVQIVREINNDLMYDLTTDSAGKTKRVSLPTPINTVPYGQNSEVLYANYTVTLNFPGHYTTVYKSVSIFEGSSSFLTLAIFAAR